MVRDEAIRLVELAVSVDPGTIKGTESLTDVGWDSLASVSFVALVDEHQGRTIAPKTVANCRSVAELVALLLEAS
jgi:acyl carrier protein